MPMHSDPWLGLAAGRGGAADDHVAGAVRERLVPHGGAQRDQVLADRLLRPAVPPSWKRIPCSFCNAPDNRCHFGSGFFLYFAHHSILNRKYATFGQKASDF